MQSNVRAKRRVRFFQLGGLATVLCLFLLFALSAQQQSLHAQGQPTGKDSVEISNSGLLPAESTVKVGDSVEWENTTDAAIARLTFANGTVSPDIAAGERYSLSFNQIGTFSYTCSLYPDSPGVVIVTESSDITPTVGTGTPQATETPEETETPEATETPESEKEGVELSVTSRREQPIVAGATIDYRISYENHSDISATNAVLTVTLPASATLVSSQQQGTDFAPTSQNGGTLVYQLGTLAAESENRIDLRVQMPASIPSGTDMSLIANISADNAGGRSEDNHTEADGTVATPELSVGVRPQSGSKFSAGGVVTYVVAYANHSDEAEAQNVTITLQLPAVASFISAQKGDDAEDDSFTQQQNGNQVIFLLPKVDKESSGRILATLQLSDTLNADDPITVTVTIDSATAPRQQNGDDDDGSDDHGSDSQHVSSSTADLFVRLSSTSDGEVGGRQNYLLSFGNRGDGAASDVQVTLNLPTGVSSPTFSLTPTSQSANIVIWQMPTLTAHSEIEPIRIAATINDGGQLTATATISGTGGEQESEIEREDNEAVEREHIYPLYRPTIFAPKGAIVSPKPVIRGIGSPGATVSVYLSGTQQTPSSLLGTAIVGANYQWTFTPTQPFSPTGWYWITATQALDTRISGIAGASFNVSNTLSIDPESIKRDGVPTGGVNATLGWSPNHFYKLEMKILACAAPLTPTLQASFFNLQGLMTGYEYYSGTLSNDTVAFNFRAPNSLSAFELFVEYDCAIAPAQAATTAPNAQLSGSIHHRECLNSPECSDDPPEPPHECEDCYPGKPPRPRPVDPDGFIYDAAAVRAGATITQSIIDQSWVTATVQLNGIFDPWNALEYAQVNPQYTDSSYPDKVQVPGYYQFLVPPGAYRIVVNAPGYLPYESSTIRVASDPVTLHIGLERSGAQSVQAAAAPANQRVYLPLIVH